MGLTKKRNNPHYPPSHQFTASVCTNCGELYEVHCKLPHICKKQNSYRINVKGKQITLKD